MNIKISPQKKATIVSSTVAAILTLLKLIIGIFSGSVAVLASAVDSILDMFVSIFNYFAVLNSEKPADKNFNYGRGKIEAFALVIEGVIITLSGIFLLYHAVKKAILGAFLFFIVNGMIKRSSKPPNGIIKCFIVPA